MLLQRVARDLTFTQKRRMALTVVEVAAMLVPSRQHLATRAVAAGIIDAAGPPSPKYLDTRRKNKKTPPRRGLLHCLNTVWSLGDSNS